MSFDVNDYRKLGWSLVRLHHVVGEHCTCRNPECAHKGKHPIGPRWQLGNGDIKRTDNVGVLLGAPSRNLICCDIDQKNGKDGAAFLREQGWQFPRSLSAHTPNSGAHVLLQSPYDYNPSVVLYKHRGLEILGDGAQIVVAPSITEIGEYGWNNWGDEPVAPAPSWVVDLIQARRDERMNRGERRTFEHTAAIGERMRRAAAYLRRMSPAVSGAGGHNRLFRVACVIALEFDLPESAVLELLMNEYNPRCAPPWSEREVLHKIQDAYLKGDNVVGAKLVQKEKLAPMSKRVIVTDNPTLSVNGNTALEPDEEPESKPRLRVVPDNERASNRPQIYCSAQIGEMADQAIDALTQDPTVFTKSGLLMRACNDVLFRLDLPALKERVSRAADWHKFSQQRNQWEASKPDVDAVMAVASRGVWPELREIVGVADHPLMNPDGTIDTTPGYNSTSRFYLTNNAADVVFDQQPTRGDARLAIEYIYGFIDEFTFELPSHKTTWLAGLLTPIVRGAHSGVNPFILFDANDSGAGKGMLVHAIATILTGHEMPMIPYSSDDEGVRKVITSKLISGVSMLTFDNIRSKLSGAALECAITTPVWTDRLLGTNQTVNLDSRIAWFGTGNNVDFSTDMGRRILPSRVLKPIRTANHEFKYPDLMETLRNKRKPILSACCTILRAYQHAGMPKQDVISGDSSYTQWLRHVRDALVFCGEPDIYEAAKVHRAENDRDAVLLAQVIAGWRTLAGGEGLGVRIADAIMSVKKHGFPELETALTGIDEQLNAQRIGSWFAGFKGKVVDNSCLTITRKDRNKFALWAVQDL